MLTFAENLGIASKNTKATTFCKHGGFKGPFRTMMTNIGIDIDDIYNVADMLSEHYKESYSLKITKIKTCFEEELLHIGYLKLDKIDF